MSTALASTQVRTSSPPMWPTFVMGGFATLATLSILQGVVDIFIPVIVGEPAFGFLFHMTERYGATFFVGYIFIHNLGLASIVPGYGFLAAWYEKRTLNRGLIGVLLAGAVLASLLVAGHFILTAPDRFDVPFASALLLCEACGVLALAYAGARQLWGFVPTPRYEWSLVTPFRQLAIPFAYSATLLLVTSLIEAWAVVL